MTTHEMIKLVDLCEKKYEDYVYVRVYGDGSGALCNRDDDELTTWDDLSEMEKEIKGWLK